MNSHPTQILIVEDDHALREALLDTASLAGFEATGAADGRVLSTGFLSVPPGHDACSAGMS